MENFIAHVNQAQSAFESASRDFDSVNDLLKAQLPVYIDLRVPFIDPILESLLLFQLKFFTNLLQSSQPMDQFTDSSLSIINGYNKRFPEVQEVLDHLTILSESAYKESTSGAGLLTVKCNWMTLF